MSFRRSLQPMLTWMRWIGVFLESPGTISCTRTRWLSTSFGLAVFFLNILINGYYLAGITVYLTLAGGTDKSAFAMKWNLIIGLLNKILVLVFSQLFLLSASVTKWPSLVQVLSQIENENMFEPKDFQQFRRIFVSGLAWLVSEIVIFFLTIFVPIILTDNMSEFAKWWNASCFFLFIYMFSGCILFSCLGWMTSEMLTILTKRVEVAEQQSKSVSYVNWNDSLDAWKHQNYRILQLVDNINGFSGPLLLLVTTFCFILTINSSFDLMLGVRENIFGVGNMVHFSILLIDFSWFSILIYIPHRMRRSAINFSKQLQAIQIRTPHLQNKVNFLVLEVLNSLPKITALGLFDVNLTLIPTLIGTTLTYLIILCQFQFS